jgi:hypothetical protein
MMRWSAVPRGVAVWAGILVAVVAYACASQAFSEYPLIYPSGDWDTRLPPGVDSSPAQFVNTLNASPPGDSVHIRTRPGRCNVPCTVQVKIQTLGNTQEIDTAPAPVMGRPIARIENLDPTDVEGLFGFRPSTQAEYVFWVDSDPGSHHSRLTVLWVPRTGAGRVRAGFQKNLILCHARPAGHYGVSDVDFYEYKHGVSPCTVPGAMLRPAAKEASLISLRPFVALYARVRRLLRGETISDGAWIDCNSGCCT